MTSQCRYDVAVAAAVASERIALYPTVAAAENSAESAEGAIVADALAAKH